MWETPTPKYPPSEEEQGKYKCAVVEKEAFCLFC